MTAPGGVYLGEGSGAHGPAGHGCRSNASAHVEKRRSINTRPGPLSVEELPCRPRHRGGIPMTRRFPGSAHAQKMTSSSGTRQVDSMTRTCPLEQRQQLHIAPIAIQSTLVFSLLDAPSWPDLSSSTNSTLPCLERCQTSWF